MHTVDLQGLTIKLFLFQLFFLFPQKLRKQPLFLKNNNSAMRCTRMRENIPPFRENGAGVANK